MSLFLLWLLLSGSLLILYPRNELFLWVNQKHNLLFDHLMTVLSAYGRGDSITLVFVALLIFPFYRNREYIGSTALFGLTLPLINYLSKDFFAKPRPLGEFHPSAVHTVPWLENLYFDSFPSGHTMGAFGFFFMLHHFLPKSNFLISCLFCILATGCAYSRMYLGQHFLADLFAGSLIGVGVSFVILILVQFFTSKKKNYV